MSATAARAAKRAASPHHSRAASPRPGGGQSPRTGSRRSSAAVDRRPWGYGAGTSPRQRRTPPPGPRSPRAAAARAEAMARRAFLGVSDETRFDAQDMRFDDSFSASVPMPAPSVTPGQRPGRGGRMSTPQHWAPHAMDSGGPALAPASAGTRSQSADPTMLPCRTSFDLNVTSQTSLSRPQYSAHVHAPESGVTGIRHPVVPVSGSERGQGGKAVIVACYAGLAAAEGAVAAASAAARAVSALLHQQGCVAAKRVLTDGATGPGCPTRANVVSALQWLVDGARPGDSLFLAWCGAGGEPDGVRPADYTATGDLGASELYDLLVRPLPQGCRLTVVADGAPLLLELPHALESGPQGLRLTGGEGRGAECEVLLITAHGAVQGAVTHALAEALARSPSGTPPTASLLCHIAEGCHAVGGARGPVVARIASSRCLAETDRIRICPGQTLPAGQARDPPQCAPEHTPWAETIVLPAPPASAAVAAPAHADTHTVPQTGGAPRGIPGASRALLVCCWDEPEAAPSRAWTAATGMLARFLQRNRFLSEVRTLMGPNATGASVVSALSWLGSDAQPGDSFFLGICGPGAPGGGMVCSDGMMLDRERVRELVLGELPAGTRLTVILDGPPDALPVPVRLTAAHGEVHDVRDSHSPVCSNAHVCVVSAHGAPPGALVTAAVAALNSSTEPLYTDFSAAASVVLGQQGASSGARINVGLTRSSIATDRFHLGVLPGATWPAALDTSRAVVPEINLRPGSPAAGQPYQEGGAWGAVQGVARAPPLPFADGDDVTDVLAHLRAFYRVVNPSKIGAIDTIATEYDSQWADLYADLEERYSCAGYFDRRRRLLHYLRAHCPDRIDEADAMLGSGAFEGDPSDPPSFGALVREFGDDSLLTPAPARPPASLARQVQQRSSGTQSSPTRDTLQRLSDVDPPPPALAEAVADLVGTAPPPAPA
eukprot:Hpha_TRINITY_DN31519_c0_g1::TRINITY_DN31519_c0_g1_i1::g.1698::m.1698